MSKKILYTFLLLSFMGFATHAQDRVIHGTVRTFDSIPLIGAQVYVKSTKQIVETDSLGNFWIACNAKEKLKVSAHGFNNQKVKLTQYTKFVLVNLRLKPGEKNREYAIGYGHVSDRDKLNAVANLTNDDFDFSQYSNMYDLIQGRFASVQVKGTDIIIRGESSINLSSAALIVVDGMATDSGVLSSIPPINVKSINIIKDGSSAIYGARGANGVVIIETKRGGD